MANEQNQTRMAEAAAAFTLATAQADIQSIERAISPETLKRLRETAAESARVMYQAGVIAREEAKGQGLDLMSDEAGKLVQDMLLLFNVATQEVVRELDMLERAESATAS